jgi:hypothetical protein
LLTAIVPFESMFFNRKTLLTALFHPYKRPI